MLQLRGQAGERQVPGEPKVGYAQLYGAPAPPASASSLADTMTASRISGLPGGIGLWGGFLDRVPAPEAVAAARDIEAAGIRTVWLQEYSGVDPFVRAALYLQRDGSPDRGARCGHDPWS